MRAEVIDRRDPLADDLLQLRDRVHSLGLNVIAATGHVSALIARELLQERIEGAEEPFDGALVGRLIDAGGLNRDS